ncbi:hypothetical protein BA896_022960 [Janthinobacterium lividum]|uniref:GAF domain-containing protein n=1 Tax=Janthinobacterium lividum TaxID=29581 RepID=A0A1E8PJ28_9BURK|nr:hypothetical protein BA896_022960 [Janthinobacterium lividum]
MLIDEADRFYALSAPSLPQDLCMAVRHGGAEASPFGTAAFSGAPVYCGDISRDAHWSAGRKEAMLHGYRACWVAPVFGAKGISWACWACFSRPHVIPRNPKSNCWCWPRAWPRMSSSGASWKKRCTIASNTFITPSS